MTHSRLRGDRFGGVVFDVQQYRRDESIHTPPGERGIQRLKLIHAISTLISMVEDIDDFEFANPRIDACIQCGRTPWPQCPVCPP